MHSSQWSRSRRARISPHTVHARGTASFRRRLTRGLDPDTVPARAAVALRQQRRDGEQLRLRAPSFGEDHRYLLDEWATEIIM